MGKGRAAPTNGADIGAAAHVQPSDDTTYGKIYPYHAELCALSELRKLPGHGVPLRSGIGGHALLYLNGVTLDRAAAYPMLKLRAPGEAPERYGVGISVNSHYKNANWVAVEGREFLWHGSLKPGERLTQDAYERTQHQAKAAGMLEGVQFHDHLFRKKPAGMSARDYMYEISIATDYAACFGRAVYRTRVPLDGRRMAAIVDYLNGLNAPYRNGSRDFTWRLFNDNCAHVAHNALAVAGVWAPWPTGQFFMRAVLNFPVPKNELVDLALRTNDLPIGDVQAMYEDEVARRLLLEANVLPTAPGALAVAAPAVEDNDIYDVKRLRLIFYDNPFWGPYRFHFKKIFSESRYVDLGANLRHFSALYDTALASRQRGTQQGFAGARAAFQRRYDSYVALEAAKTRRQLRDLRQTEIALETVS